MTLGGQIANGVPALQDPPWAFSDLGARSCEVRFSRKNRRRQPSQSGPKSVASVEKVIWSGNQNFSGLLMRFARGDMRDHIGRPSPSSDKSVSDGDQIKTRSCRRRPYLAALALRTEREFRRRAKQERAAELRLTIAKTESSQLTEARGLAGKRV